MSCKCGAKDNHLGFCPYRKQSPTTECTHPECDKSHPDCKCSEGVAYRKSREAALPSATRHKWADVLIAIAEGKQVEWIQADPKHRFWPGNWNPVSPQTIYFLYSAADHLLWRIKPEPEPDVTIPLRLIRLEGGGVILSTKHKDNICATFDGETGALKSVEVIK